MTLEIDGESMLIISLEIKLAPALWNGGGGGGIRCDLISNK